MSLIMVINDSDFVMVSVDRTTIPTTLDENYYCPSSKISKTPFGLAATFGDAHLGLMTRQKLMSTEVADQEEFAHIILDQWNTFIEELPEREEDMDYCGAVVTYCTVGIHGQRTQGEFMIPPSALDKLIEVDGVHGGFWCDSNAGRRVIRRRLAKLTEHLANIRTDSRISRIREYAKLMTKLHKEVSKISTSATPECDIAVQMDNNAVWACRKIDGEFRLIEF
jgi:hypothetical protein